MDISNIISNSAAKKIQKQFREYRVEVYRKKISKLNLTVYCKEHSFNEFIIHIKNKNVINTVTKYLDILKQSANKDLLIRYQLILSCYMICNYADEVLGKDKDLYQGDKDLLKWTKEIVEKLENGGLNISKQYILLKNFNVVFNSWKENDKHKTIEKIIISYHNMNEHLKVIKANNKMEDKQKQESIQEIDSQMNKMLCHIQRIDPKFQIKYLEENIESVYKKIQEGWSTIKKQIGNTMKKAYHDLVIESLQKGELKPTYDLLMDICKRLLIICPEKRKESIREKMSESIIMNFMASGNWTSEFVTFLKFLTDLIILLGASGDDEQIMEWKKATDLYYNLDFKVVLPQFLIEMQEKIDRIYQLIALYSEANN